MRLTIQSASSLNDRFVMIGVTVALLALITIPYVYAVRQAGEAHVFGGFLLNPLDGNSYMAKMYEGWRGDWLFTLPYTAEKGHGIFIYFFYILLGHIARILGISLTLAYHAMRFFSALVLSLAIYQFFIAYLPGHNAVRLAFILACFGSGMGWLALPFGGMTSDFWVAEAYPFLSAYVNPHFPLSLALLLFLVLPVEANEPTRSQKIVKQVGIILASLALATMSPFAIVIALVCWAGMASWELLLANLSHQNVNLGGYLSRLAWIAIGGLPMLIYQLVVISFDPLLSGWSAQNQTPAPPLWDIVISLSPLLLLAPFGVRSVLSSRHTKARLVVVWCLASLVLLYTPLSLQRRFLMGLFIPVVALGVIALESLVKDGRRFWFWSILLIVWVLPTNFLVVQAGLHGIQTRDPWLYLSKDEAAALDWIEINTPPDALVLAAPDTGLFIPAHTGRRVVYGHPYETVQAESQKMRVERLFQGDLSLDSDALLNMVDFVYYGPREREIGQNPRFDLLKTVYKNPSVLIYSTHR